MGGLQILVSETHVPVIHVKLPAGDPGSSTKNPAIPTCASYSRTTFSCTSSSCNHPFSPVHLNVIAVMEYRKRILLQPINKRDT